MSKLQGRGYSLLLRYPGRRFACPGLLSYRPYGTSFWLATLDSSISPATLRAMFSIPTTKVGTAEPDATLALGAGNGGLGFGFMGMNWRWPAPFSLSVFVRCTPVNAIFFGL